ncbi:hypothetical protein FQA39_LY12794 [Lamprigera yunnana]|nr:hypothetical protein FQA39_LY12794 [Lamprigera yunnana]
MFNVTGDPIDNLPALTGGTAPIHRDPPKWKDWSIWRSWSGVSVFAGVGLERTREGMIYITNFKEADVLSKTSLVFGQMNEPPGARMRVALTGLTIAEYFRDEQSMDVLLFIDNIFRFTQAGSEVSALLGRVPSAVGYQPTLSTEMGALQERITSTKNGSITSVQAVYTQELFLIVQLHHLEFYPAVDPLASSSRMLDPEVIGHEHYEVASAVQQTLQKYQDLQSIIAILGMDELSEEVVSSRKGSYVKVTDTVRSFKSVLDGQVDEIPELYFLYVSTIDEVLEKYNAAKANEYKGISPDHEQSYKYFMNVNLFDLIDINKENAFIPDGVNTASPEKYDQAIATKGGVDLQLLGIGVNGHIGFNEPGTSFDSKTSVVDLAKSTIEVNSRFFDSLSDVPTQKSNKLLCQWT